MKQNLVTINLGMTSFDSNGRFCLEINLEKSFGIFYIQKFQLRTLKPMIYFESKTNLKQQKH